MGDIFKGGYNPKAGLRLIGIDLDANRKAALAKAQAIRDAAAATARQAAFAAQAAQQSIETQSAQRIASEKAQDLLGTPLEVADVDTSQTSNSDDDDDLLRRRGVRSTYSASSGSKSAGLNI